MQTYFSPHINHREKGPAGPQVRHSCISYLGTIATGTLVGIGSVSGGWTTLERLQHRHKPLPGQLLNRVGTSGPMCARYRRGGPNRYEHSLFWLSDGATDLQKNCYDAEKAAIGQAVGHAPRFATFAFGRRSARDSTDELVRVCGGSWAIFGDLK